MPSAGRRLGQFCPVFFLRRAVHGLPSAPVVFLLRWRCVLALSGQTRFAREQHCRCFWRMSCHGGARRTLPRRAFCSPFLPQLWQGGRPGVPPDCGAHAMPVRWRRDAVAARFASFLSRQAAERKPSGGKRMRHRSLRVRLAQFVPPGRFPVAAGRHTPASWHPRYP